ncbi:MAG TPA: aspartate carbamoyltransferase catalytic subunit [Dongiaceae bacterium]|nr:aspartate carbamoyltransferase catalytic subunit [Dongiaceae bacterium]
MSGGPNRTADSRHFLGLEGLSREALLALLLESARERTWLAAGEPNRKDLAGVTIVLAFIEDSTRTRTSFEIAAQRLGANTVVFASAASSLNKGETLLDTVRLFEAMGAALVVVRHPSSGAPAWLARQLGTMGVVNAGDGMHEHPTQGLLDLLTLQDAWEGRFEGRRLAIVGDIAHSRVARSAIAGLTTLGTRVTVCGPGTLMPADVESLGCEVAASLDQALAGADAAMALRIQSERMEKGLLPSLGEYARLWGLSPRRVALMAPHAVVMHPGPVNRGVELAHEVADGPRSRILAQVANGVAVRCAVLKRCVDAIRKPHGFTAEVAAR